MGRPLSLAISFFSALRVAGTTGEPGSGVVFTPAHTKPNGKPVSSKAVFTAFRNTIGDNARNDPFQFTVWGPRAEMACKCLPPGKAIDLYAEPQSYLGRSFDENRNPRLDAAGQPIMIRKVGWNVMRLSYGEDAEKRIIFEKTFADMNSPRVLWDWRPRFWDDASHPDNGTWKAVCGNRNGAHWNGTDPIFGYARVQIPVGTLDWTKINKGETQQYAGNVPAANGATNPAPQAQQANPAGNAGASPVPPQIAQMMGNAGAAGGSAPSSY